MSLSTPILFLIFNRPLLTSLVFEEIRKQRPERLYIAADGPRLHVDTDADKCNETRRLVMDGIDWECTVKTLFRSTNLGCGRAVSESISWFFENEEAGIILEDDCLPHETFFTFCENMLSKYEHEEQVMHIGGVNLQKKGKNSNSYYFSRYIHVWGWATWRRAWQLYQFNLPDENPQLFQKLKLFFPKRSEFKFWEENYRYMAKLLIDTWDIQWSFACHKHNGLGITPPVNLVSNLGFGLDATHTLHNDPTVAALPLVPHNSIRHPAKIKVNKRADHYTFDRYFRSGNSFLKNVRFRIGKRIPILKRIYLDLISKRDKKI